MARQIPAAAIHLIRHHEQLHELIAPGQLRSYLCPSRVWTIGYGSTMLRGMPVMPGTHCTVEEAEDQFDQDLRAAARTVELLTEVPLSDQQFGALTSLVQNIGSGNYSRSTLRRRLNAGDDVETAMREEFPRWNKGDDDEVLEGLVKRRQAELALLNDPSATVLSSAKAVIRFSDAAKHDRGLPWQTEAWRWLFQQAPASSWDAMQERLPQEVIAGFAQRFRNERATSPAPAAGAVMLDRIPRFTQRDSQWIAQRDRKCYSSTNAMLVEFLKPGTLPGINGDDLYFQRLQSLGGDTTEWAAQQRTLTSYGIHARLVKNADWRMVEQQLRRGHPVPLGYLHRGPVEGPRGGGHWCLCYGLDATHLWISDPWGEPNMVTGETMTQGNWQGRVTRLNFSKRWMVNPNGDGTYRFAPGNGWAVVIDRIA